MERILAQPWTELPASLSRRPGSARRTESLGLPATCWEPAREAAEVTLGRPLAPRRRRPHPRSQGALQGAALHRLRHHRPPTHGRGTAAPRRGAARRRTAARTSSSPCSPTSSATPGADPQLASRPDPPGGADTQLGQALEIAERQVTHMARLLDDLLDVSRFTQGKVQLRKVPVEFSTVVAHAVETPRPLIEAEGHPLPSTCRPRPYRRRRSHTAGTGRGEPPEQCRQIHRARRRDRSHGRARGRRGGAARARTPASV